MPTLSRPREHVPQPAAPPGRGLFSCARAAPRDRGVARRSARRSACGPTIPSLPIETLSGGNQQKVVVGALAAHRPARCCVLEDPTAGVDVGAKAEIYRLLAVALAGGARRSSSSRPTSRRSRRSATARWSSTGGRVVAELAAADLSIENLLARRARRGVGRCGAAPGAAMQSIKSNALEPTARRAGAAAARPADRPAAAGLRPADPDWCC